MPEEALLRVLNRLIDALEKLPHDAETRQLKIELQCIRTNLESGAVKLSGNWKPLILADPTKLEQYGGDVAQLAVKVKHGITSRLERHA